MEKKLQGYRRFKNTTDPLLLKIAEQYKQRCLEALSLFPTAIRHAPSKEVAQKIKNIQLSITRELGTNGLKNIFLSPIFSLLALVEKFKLKHFAYPQVKVKRTRYKLSMGLLQPLSIYGNGLLTIKPRVPYTATHPLIVDLHGSFTMITAKKLIKRIQAILKENTQHLAINFRGVTSTERDALFQFLKKLRSQKMRIKIISIGSLRTDLSDVVNYAKNYFEVYTDVDSLNASFI
jgi:anti-anti-sigma regulatory factor